MCVTICGRFLPDEGAVAGYGNRIRVKYTAKWGVQIAGMIFQTHSSVKDIYNHDNIIFPVFFFMTLRLLCSQQHASRYTSINGNLDFSPSNCYI